MGIITTVKGVFGGSAADDNEQNGVEQAQTQPATATGQPTHSPPWASEADYVLTTGHTREETLLELVEAHGGRVKQAELVTLTGWSKSSVSRKLSSLEDDGTITRIQIGRCKIVLLPDKSLVQADASTGDDTHGMATRSE